MISCRLNPLLIIVFTFCALVVGSTPNVTKINIPLAKSVTWANRELYNNFQLINRLSTLQVKFTNINKNVSYIVFQVHSHLYNVTVYNGTISRGSYVSGTNIGLYSPVKPFDASNFYIFNENEDIDVNIMISVHGYGNRDPIPGGCNMEFPIPVSPFMSTNLQKDFVLVDAAPAMHYLDPLCIMYKTLNVVFYLMYLPERNYGSIAYFDGIQKMLTLESIRENGYRMPDNRWPMRRTLSAYPGTGAIYVVVATNAEDPEYYSVYIPSHNYACSPLDVDSCELIDDYLSKFLCASLIFVGVFMCFFGHRFFKTEMFLFGFLTGFLITYIIISLNSNLDRPVLITGCLISGIFFGALWLTFWWYYGIPVIAVSLPLLNMGFLISAIVYNNYPGELWLLEEDFNFWSIFILVMLLVTVTLISLTFISNILCCAVLGAYAVIYPMDFYLGSNLKYIIINTIRRAVVPKFNKAVLTAPFEWRDTLMVVIWTLLAATGLLFQHYHNRGRPPFPPPPRSVRPSVPTDSDTFPRRSVSSVGLSRRLDERTPLLA